MIEPSGENRGSVSTSGVDVRRLAAPPLRPVTHRSPAYWKAIASRLIAGCRRRRVPWAPAVPAATNPAMIESLTIERGMTDLRVGLSLRSWDDELLLRAAPCTSGARRRIDQQP